MHYVCSTIGCNIFSSRQQCWPVIYCWRLAWFQCKMKNCHAELNRFYYRSTFCYTFCTLHVQTGRAMYIASSTWVRLGLHRLCRRNNNGINNQCIAMNKSTIDREEDDLESRKKLNWFISICFLSDSLGFRKSIPQHPPRNRAILFSLFQSRVVACRQLLPHCVMTGHWIGSWQATAQDPSLVDWSFQRRHYTFPIKKLCRT